MSQTCQYSHSLNQSLVARTGSATGSDHSLDALVVFEVSSNVHDHVGWIKDLGVRNHVVQGLPWDASGALRCLASLYATNTAVQSVAVPQPPMNGRTVNGHKMCFLSLVAKVKQGCAVLLESDAAK
eukprot:4529612-Pleurochrysis_carterae.AAC.1